MQYFPTYLIYLAVVARAVGWIQDSSPIPALVWILLGVYGLFLFSQEALSRRWPWYPRGYILVQSCLVSAMLYLAPALDFLPMLFYPLSFQAVQFFRPWVGFTCIGTYSVAMAGMVFRGLEWGPGALMLLGSTGINALMGSFAHLMRRTDRRRDENQQLLGSLQEAYRQLKDSAAQSQALAAAEERHRLGRELHDSLTQILFSMNLAAQAAQMAVLESPALAEMHLTRLQTLTRSAAGEVQALTGQVPLRAVLKDGMGAALLQLAQERLLQDGMQLEVDVRGERRLPETVEIAIYRTIQEAVNNILRHASVNQGRITLNLEDPRASLVIEDAGCGFDPQGAKRSGGYGLAGMAERAGEIGWDLRIESQPGRGTRIELREKTV